MKLKPDITNSKVNVKKNVLLKCNITGNKYTVSIEICLKIFKRLFF